jgi:hypothetical protein
MGSRVARAPEWLESATLCGTRREGKNQHWLTNPSRFPLPASRQPMPINFRHDVDRVLEDAKKQNKPVLLDFSAAPM